MLFHGVQVMSNYCNNAVFCPDLVSTLSTLTVLGGLGSGSGSLIHDLRYGARPGECFRLRETVQ